MKILFLDDSYEILDSFGKILTDMELPFVICYDIFSADQAWEKGDIDVIITDLNIPTNGLSDSEIELTHGSLLTGWVWLATHVCRGAYHPVLERTIVFSDYLSDAVDAINRYHVCDNLFSSVKRISKTNYQEILYIIGAWNK